MFSSILRSIPLGEKVLFYESIANLLDGGVTLVSALRGFAERLPQGALKDAVENTIFFVEGGDALNTAMRKISNFYGEKEIAIVESGEQTGMLKTTFEAIATEMRMQEDLRRKVVGALMYPFIVMIFLGLALVVVMVYVIPQIMPIIAEMTTDIPWSTRSLIAVSDFLSNNIVFLLLGFLSFASLVYAYSNTEHGRRFFDREKIFLPVIGTVYKNYIIVQVMSTFYLLTNSGVSIVKALRLTGASSGNRIVADMYNQIADDVSHGKKITESFQGVDLEGRLFTPDILQMIESAERTSQLDVVTKKISEQYKREVDSSLSVMVKFIEPTALLLAGIFVLWFSIAIFSSIMQVVAVDGAL